MTHLLENSLVINLAKATDRLAQAQDNFKKLGTKFLRIEAVNTCYLPKKINMWSQPGQLGGATTHNLCAKVAKHMNWDHVAIFEDDFVLCEDFEQRLETGVKQLPKDWDIVFLGGCRHQAPPTYYSDNLVRANKTFGMVGYILNKKFYDKYIECTNDIGNLGIEYGLFKYQHKVNSFAIYPEVITQKDHQYSFMADGLNGKMTTNIDEYFNVTTKIVRK